MSGEATNTNTNTIHTRADQHRSPTRKRGFRPVNTLHSPKKPDFAASHRQLSLDLDLDLDFGDEVNFSAMVRERSPSRTSSGQHLSPQKRDQARAPLANISARIQSPSRTQRSSTDMAGGDDIEFGKASPIRNPLHPQQHPRPLPKKAPASVFIPKARVPQQHSQGQQQPRQVSGFGSGSGSGSGGFYLAGQRPRQPSPQAPAAQSTSLSAALESMTLQHRNFSNDSDFTQIARPANAPLKTVHPPSKPFFSSVSTAHSNPPFVPPRNVITIDDSDDGERFDPDAEIRKSNGRFGAEDPYMYVDSNRANENIKNLLEGAFDDEEEKGRTRLRKRIKKVEPEQKEVKGLADRLAALEVKDKEAEANDDEDDEEEDGTVDGLTVKLLPHQVEGVSWMIDKEIGRTKTRGLLPHGGILADDMGLGKTVQSVALILTNPRPAFDAKPEHKNQKLPGKEVSKGTLVVAPLALIKQWEAEIKTKVTKSHALKVLVHHGPNRTKSSAELKRYDVVITTFQTLTSEHAGSNMTVSTGSRIGCFGVHWYRIMLDEAHSIKNRNAKSTLAACALNSWYRWCLTGTPLQNNLDELQSLIKFLRIKPYCELPAWKDAITKPMKAGRGGLAMRRLQVFLKAFMKRRTKDILKLDGALNFGGKGKETNGGMQIVKREVLTVECDFDAQEKEFYDRLQARADKRMKDMMDGNQKTDYIGALVLLLRLRQMCDHPQLIEMAMSKDKDAMTIGNASKAGKVEDAEIDDLAALMGGVSVETKHCDVCQIKLSTLESRDGAVRCGECEADVAEIKKKDKGDGKKAKKEKSKAKKAKSEVMTEPRRARNRKVIEDSDDDEEEEVGEWVAKGPEEDIDLGRAGGSDDEDADGGGETLNTIDTDRSEDDTSDIEDSPPRAARRHRARPSTSSNEEDSEADEDDEEQDSDNTSQSDSQAGSDSESDASPSNLLSGLGHTGKSAHAPSTKVRHLLRILHRETPEHKTIVFSQFTTMLDLISPHLITSGLKFVRYDGSMRPDAREASLKALREDPRCRVLLCSLKCGSLGLNLTAASRVVIVEPFWNPFVEEQAIDRVHRLNQTVDVKVFRLTIRNSVEERILELQEKKRELANAAIEGGKGMGKLSMQDILGLFRRDAEHGEGDQEDKMFEKFGSDSRLLDGPDGAALNGTLIAPLSSRARQQGSGSGGRERKEHEVYGRRW